jgi:hypothetical protein
VPAGFGVAAGERAHRPEPRDEDGAAEHAMVTLGLLITYPVNVSLVRRGVKHAM